MELLPRVFVVASPQDKLSVSSYLSPTAAFPGKNKLARVYMEKDGIWVARPMGPSPRPEPVILAFSKMRLLLQR